MLPPTLARIATFALIASCVGCPGTLEDPARFSADASGPSCPDITQTVFLNVCATASCHSATTKAASLDLGSPNVASRLVGVAATGGPGLLIDPSAPRASVIYTKLTATPPFGVQMPFNEPALDDGTMSCVLEWVSAQVDGGASEGGLTATDGGVDDSPASDDSASDGGASPDGDDGASDEASPGSDDDDDAGEAAAPVHDAGSTRDAGTNHARDASAPDVEAPQPGGPADAGPG